VTIDSQNRLLSETLKQLEESKVSLKHYSHNLELLVSERTAELQQVNEKLKQLATLDGLTQVLNRQYFDDYLGKHWQVSQERQLSIGLLLIDVDYFKPYNDCYGHLAGDDCLKKVAQAIASGLSRTEDIVARYGGEEFGVLLPITNYVGAVRVANEIFSQINTLKIPHRCSKTSEYLTISMGISCLIPHADMHQDSLIEMADIALYHSKDAGRNQYSLFKDITDSKQAV
jgi:diguanylate cyclase (GGDEF)-like protein